MDYKEIIKNTMKYHYFLKTETKLMRIASANKKSDAKKMALNQIGKHIDNLIGKKLILLIVKRTHPEKNIDVKLIKGNIGFFLNGVLLKVQLKLKMMKWVEEIEYIYLINILKNIKII